MSKVRAQPVLKSFSKTSAENSGGTENSAEISSTNGIHFFCYMYESSLQHPVWVPEINVTACNSVNWEGWDTLVRDSSSTGCIVQGMHHPRDMSFNYKGHNVQRKGKFLKVAQV